MESPEPVKWVPRNHAIRAARGLAGSPVAVTRALKYAGTYRGGQ
jgi:hypothetical protein